MGVIINLDDWLQKYKAYFRLKNCKAEYLLFKKKGNGVYNHLGIAVDTFTGERYIETFFREPSDMYIAGQYVVKVKSFTLYAPDGEAIVTDSF